MTRGAIAYATASSASITTGEIHVLAGMANVLLPSCREFALARFYTSSIKSGCFSTFTSCSNMKEEVVQERLAAGISKHHQPQIACRRSSQ